MKRFKLSLKIIIFSLLIIFIANINLISKENDKKITDKKDKKEKEIKEKKEKEIKEKKETTSNIKDKIENAGILSEKIHSEKIDISNIDKKNNLNNIETTDKIKKENQIKDFTQKYERLQVETNDMIREIQQSTDKDISNIKDKFSYTRDIINNIEDNNIEFIKNLDKEERDLIKKQTSTIENSKNNLIKILDNLDKELDKKSKNIENLFNKTKELEKEIRTIYRQYRAIEWILFEK